MSRHLLFSLQQQSITYQAHQVLTNISLEIHSGESVAIIGISGCGKSSLLKVLFEQQYQNSAFCAQQPLLVDSLSVYHNIYMGQLQKHHFVYNLINLMRPFSTPKTEIRQLSKLIALEPYLFTSVDKLSGGQQQRTNIARALYQQQAIFIADEPFSSIDPVQANMLLQLIKSRHHTIIIALHNKQMAINDFDRVIALSNKGIIFDGPATQLTDELLEAIYQQPNTAMN